MKLSQMRFVKQKNTKHTFWCFCRRMIEDGEAGLRLFSLGVCSSLNQISNLPIDAFQISPDVADS